MWIRLFAALALSVFLASSASAQQQECSKTLSGSFGTAQYTADEIVVQAAEIGGNFEMKICNGNILFFFNGVGPVPISSLVESEEEHGRLFVNLIDLIGALAEKEGGRSGRGTFALDFPKLKELAESPSYILLSFPEQKPTEVSFHHTEDSLFFLIFR